VAMVVHAFVVAVALFAGVVLGSVLGGLGMNIVNIAATVFLSMMLGLVFGALALAVSAGVGKVRVSVYATIGVALVLFIANGFLPFASGLEWLTNWTPVHYYLSSDPLLNGMNWLHGGVLLALFAGLVALAVMLFDRRDLRQTG